MQTEKFTPCFVIYSIPCFWYLLDSNIIIFWYKERRRAIESCFRNVYFFYYPILELLQGRENVIENFVFPPVWKADRVGLSFSCVFREKVFTYITKCKNVVLSLSLHKFSSRSINLYLVLCIYTWLRKTYISRYMTVLISITLLSLYLCTFI